jgi:methionyl aminopeptidase
MATFEASPPMEVTGAADITVATVSQSQSETTTVSDDSSAGHICATPNCGKPATLACPTCLKLGLAPTRFCSQDCFKSSWNDHKNIHKQVKAARSDEAKLNPTSIPAEFKGYTFTGSLRPCQQSSRRTVPASIPRPDYADHPQGIPISEQQDKRTNTSIKVYSADEINGIREACRIGREVLDIAGRAVRVGITCDELDEIVHNATIERGGYPSPLNYHLFPKSVCTSVNEVSTY